MCECQIRELGEAGLWHVRSWKTEHLLLISEDAAGASLFGLQGRKGKPEHLREVFIISIQSFSGWSFPFLCCGERCTVMTECLLSQVTRCDGSFSTEHPHCFRNSYFGQERSINGSEVPLTHRLGLQRMASADRLLQLLAFSEGNQLPKVICAAK